MGALHALHADGSSDPSAVCGGLYEMLNSHSVVVDHAGIPGLLGASGRARRNKSEDRKIRRNYEITRYDHDMNAHGTNIVNTLTRHEHTRRTRTRGCLDVMHLKLRNTRRGPFAPYNGLTKHMPRLRKGY